MHALKKYLKCWPDTRDKDFWIMPSMYFMFYLHSGEAQLAEVELMSVERGLSAALPGELSDISADSLIRFDELNPFTYTDRSILVKNKT